MYHKQTKIGEAGNCWSTCIANILQINPQNVPDFCAKWIPGDESRQWVTDTEEWLHTYGYELHWYLEPPDDPASIVIALVKYPKWSHAVLWQHNKLLHDPYPNSTALPSAPEMYVSMVAVNKDLNKTLPRGENQCCNTCQRFYYAERKNTCPNPKCFSGR